jgi:hypothetical protein
MAETRGYIVVFKKEATAAEKDAVKAEIVSGGGQVCADLGIINGVSVKFSSDRLAGFQGKSCVNYIEADGVVGVAESKPYILTFKKDATAAQKDGVKADITAQGGTITADLSLINGIGITLPVSKLAHFQSNAAIHYIEADNGAHA